jgi:hypothetical protein
LVRALLRKNAKLQIANKRLSKYKKIIADKHLGPAFKTKANHYSGNMTQELWNNKSRAYVNLTMKAKLLMI